MNKSFYSFGLLLIMGTSLFSMDLSYETGQDQSIKNDRTISIKKGQDQSKRSRQYKSSSNATTNDISILFDPISIYMSIANECVNTVEVGADFGFNEHLSGGTIDVMRHQYLESAASTATRISEIDDIDVEGIKKYMRCIVIETSKMAQSNLDLSKIIAGRKISSSLIFEIAKEKFSHVRVEDSMIKSIRDKSLRAIDADCRFLPGNGEKYIQCGSLVFSLNNNSIKNSGISLTPGGDKIYGINTSFRVSVVDEIRNGSENSDEHASTSTRDTSMSRSYDDVKSRNQKQTTNISPFIPK